MNNTYFFPWIRKGIGLYIKDQDTLGKSDNNSTNRPQIIVNAEISGLTNDGKTNQRKVSKVINFVGPGDVLNINPNAIMRIFPESNSEILSDNGLPYIEFWEPDFAWRYTPAKANKNNLRPWIALVVCEENKCSIGVNKSGTKIVKFIVETEDSYKQIFPDPKEIYKSAHALGINENEPTFCRILNLRQKKELDKKRYKAFLIPVFEVGRLNGLEYNASTIPAQKSAWEKDLKTQQREHKDPLSFPYYYTWNFSVQGKSFVDLVEALKKNEDIRSGTDINVTSLGEGLDFDSLNKERPARTSILIPAPLQPIGTKPKKTFPSPKLNDEEELFNNLNSLLSKSPVFFDNATEKSENLKDTDPWVTPPIYGAKHVLASSLKKEDVKNFPWIEQINLDLHYRAVAGLGKKVVQRDQEYFVQRAWEQIEAIKAQNEELNKKMLSVSVSESIKNLNYKWQKEDNERKKLAKIMKNFPAMRKKFSSSLNKEKISEAFATEHFQRLTQNICNRTQFSDLDKIMENIANVQILKMPELNLKMPKIENIEEFHKKITDKPSIRFIINRTPLLCYHPLQITKNNLKNRFPFLTYTKDSFGKDDAAISVKTISFTPKEQDKADQPSYFWNRAEYEGENYEAAKSFIRDEGYKFSTLGRVKKDNFSGRVNFHHITTGNNARSERFRPKADLIQMKQVRPIVQKNLSAGISTYNSRSAANKTNTQTNIDKYQLATPYLVINNNYNLIALEDKAFHNIFPKVDKHIVRIKTGSNGKTNSSEYVFFINRDAAIQDEKIKKYFNHFNNESDNQALNPPPQKNWISTAKRLLCDGSNDEAEKLAKYLYFYHYTPCYISASNELYSDKLNGIIKDFNIIGIHHAFVSLWENICLVKETIESQPTSTLLSGIKSKIKKIAPNIPNGQTYKEIALKTSSYYTKIYGSKNSPKIEKSINLLLTSKYPIIAHPIFPEPTYQYLNRISDEFVLPGIEDIPDNSISTFTCCPAFIESFLCGMNTEMGRELLWREYPTDQRGSYFRKFWDSDTDLQNDNYFDINPIDQWGNNIGENISPSKNHLLIFAIRGELMKNFPDTKITLRKAYYDKTENGDVYLKIDDKDTKENNGILSPVSQAFIRDDIYIVGFKISPQDAIGTFLKDNKNHSGYILSFEQTPENIQFTYKPSSTHKDSVALAMECLDKKATYGKHVLTLIS